MLAPRRPLGEATPLPWRGPGKPPDATSLIIGLHSCKEHFAALAAPRVVVAVDERITRPFKARAKLLEDMPRVATQAAGTIEARDVSPRMGPEVQLDGNPMSFEGVYKANQSLDVGECTALAQDAHAKARAKLG